MELQNTEKAKLQLEVLPSYVRDELAWYEEQIRKYLAGELEGYAFEEDGMNARRAREALKNKVRQQLQSQADRQQAELQGEVTDARNHDVVEISVGADSGVRKGHRFVVTRPSTGKHIGIIEVVRVEWR